MLESKFQSLMIGKFKSCGCLVLNVHGHAMQQSGWPDLYVSGPGWRGWIELKIGDGALRTNQLLCLRDLAARQDWSYVLRLYGDSVRIYRGDELSLEVGAFDLSGLNGRRVIDLMQRCNKI